MRQNTPKDRQRSALQSLRGSTPKVSPTSNSTARAASTKSSTPTSTHSSNCGRQVDSSSITKYGLDVNDTGSNCSSKASVGTTPLHLATFHTNILQEQAPKVRYQNRKRSKNGNKVTKRGKILALRRGQHIHENDGEDKENCPVQQMSRLQKDSTKLFSFSKSKDQNSNLSIDIKEGKIKADSIFSASKGKNKTNADDEDEIGGEKLYLYRRDQRQHVDGPSIISTGRVNHAIPTNSVVDRPPNFDLYNNNTDRVIFRRISQSD